MVESTRRWQPGAWTLAGAFVAIALTACDGADAPPTTEGSATTVEAAETAEVGPSGAKRAPDHEFTSLDGSPIRLADLRGRVAIVNFWGTWCLPCRRELPELAELAETYADRSVEVIGIAVDSGEPEEIRAFLADYDVDYDIWLTGMDVAMATFGAVGFPFTLIVDREGWVRKELLGPQTLESLADEIEALLP